MSPRQSPDSLSALRGDAAGDELLVLAAAGDGRKLEQLRQRAAAGEPAPYLAGFFYFRGRRFNIDARAYITDPECADLVDAVARAGSRLERELGRPIGVLEFGVGAGTLAITVKLEHPGWIVTGLDVDADALAVAEQNARDHQVDLRLLASDFLAGWPAEWVPPDLIFADPPWGDRSDLYDARRNEAYYRCMPPRSAFPAGGARCAVHDELIRQVRTRGWSSLLVLNYGVLPLSIVADSAAQLVRHEFRRPRPNTTIILGRAVIPGSPP